MAASVSSIRDLRTQHIENFNKHLKHLILSLVKLYPSDVMIARAKTKIFLAINLSPVQVVEKTGENLYRYKDQIYMLEDGSSEQFFMETDFDADILTATQRDTEKMDIAKYIIPKLKECARTMSTEDKQKYKKMIIEMLDDYIEFMTIK